MLDSVFDSKLLKFHRRHAEMEKHQWARQLFLEWQADSNKHGLPFEPDQWFYIPQWKITNNIYRIEYVGRSLDVLALETLILEIDPEIEKRLVEHYPQMSLAKMTPAQLLFLMRKILFCNFPKIEMQEFSRNELVAAINTCALPVLASQHMAALSSFLNYGFQNGFVYLDKIADNATLNQKGIMSLIDYGVSQKFEKEAPPFSLEKYHQLRQEFVINNL